MPLTNLICSEKPLGVRERRTEDCSCCSGTGKDSYSTKECYKCKGTGWISARNNREEECSECNRTGRINGDSKCSSCEGKGKHVYYVYKYSCGVCAGRGVDKIESVPRWRENATGLGGTVDGYDEVRTYCGKCDGDGWFWSREEY